MKKIIPLGLMFLSKMYGATTVSDVSYDGNRTTVTNTFTNNDSKDYKKVKIDFKTSYADVLESISQNNPDYLGLPQNVIASEIEFTLEPSDVSDWDIKYNKGKLELKGKKHATKWETGLSTTVSYNFGDMLDFNKNGVIDENERLIKDGLVYGGFDAGKQGVGNIDRYKVSSVPEPKSPILLGLAGVVMSLYRNREKNE